jgi:hypothetical protein
MREFTSGLRREGISAEAMLAWSNQPAVRGATEGEADRDQGPANCPSVLKRAFCSLLSVA